MCSDTRDALPRPARSAPAREQDRLDRCRQARDLFGGLAKFDGAHHAVPQVPFDKLSDDLPQLGLEDRSLRQRGVTFGLFVDLPFEPLGGADQATELPFQRPMPIAIEGPPGIPRRCDPQRGSWLGSSAAGSVADHGRFADLG